MGFNERFEKIMKRNTAREDFNRAKKRAVFSTLLNFLTPERQHLLSLQEVRDLVKPRGEAYIGLKVVPIERIVGSEGRYLDFDTAFLPKVEHLRRRWENVDMAHLESISLPAVKLYEIGGAYFVRDGNHRVSVAKMQGIGSIDAEVVSLNSAIRIEPGTTPSLLKEKVISYEKEQVFANSSLGKIINPSELDFTETGRFDEILKHIEVHKYFLNMDKDYEISFEEAGASWYRKLFKPIVDLERKYKVLKKFEGRTRGDLYVWTIRHWHFLKEKYGQDVSIEDAVKDFSNRYGTTFFRKLRNLFYRRRED